MSPDKPICARFGLFELDLKNGELRRIEGGDGGRGVFLQEQPFRVLRMLIESEGKVVSRSEIKKQLWPNDTIVDFDHSINVAIGTIRRALDDSAGEPKYIETVPRRGYRLMVRPEWVEVGEVRPKIEPQDTSAANGAVVCSAGAALIGKKVSHFRVLEVIGGGGMGMVYKAEDLKLGRRVALKFLPEEMTSDPLALRRFEREAQAASSLNHPNICTIYEIEEYEGQPIIVMELLDGQTLRDHLTAAGSTRLPLEQLLAIAVQTCDGLKAAHSKGIVHRDIKPANIFLTDHGPAKILDFGLAKLVEMDEPEDDDFRSGRSLLTSRISVATDTSLTRTGRALGTASYMSPEQIRKEKLDARSDLFSFGLVLYEMSSGQRAFAGETVTEVYEELLNRAPTPVRQLNPGVPVALEAIIAKALQKDCASRYQSAAAMRADLELLPTPRLLRFRRIRKWLGLFTLVLVVAAGAVTYWHYSHRFQLSAKDTILIADLTNQTSDPVLDDALNMALPLGLAQTPFLQVLAQDKIRETLQQLNYPLNAKITPDIARKICLKTNSRAVVASSIADVGNHFRIQLSGINCQSGQAFAHAEQDVTLRNEIVHSLGVATAQLRSRMGEPDSSLKSFNKPFDLEMSSSPEALQMLANGFKHHLSPDIDTTISYYERAIEIDPSFALAYASLGTMFLAQGKNAKALAAEKKAYDLRERLVGQLRFLVETLYFSVGLGDMERSYPVYQQWVETYPLDGVARHNFADCLQRLGQYDRAIAEDREAFRLMPMEGAGSYDNIMIMLTTANRLEEAKAVFREASSRKVDSAKTHEWRHMVAFLQHDTPAMREQETWLSDARHNILSLSEKATADTYYGGFDDARRLLQQAENVATNADLPIDLLFFATRLSLRQAEAGDTVGAERLMKDALNFYRRRFGTLPPGQMSDLLTIEEDLAFARIGNIDQAEQLAERVNQTSPEDTLVQYYALPTIRAAISLRQNNPAGAIAILQPAEKYDRGYPDFFRSVYPAYVRGLAYLQLGEGRLAAAEFQKLIDHPAIVGEEVTGALARLQLGRAQVMMGDNVDARTSYRDFLSLWKDADPDLPIYKQAKAEYAKLP
jgi:eukaryotic-like serine/threonine-protein kinase